MCQGGRPIGCARHNGPAFGMEEREPRGARPADTPGVRRTPAAAALDSYRQSIESFEAASDSPGVELAIAETRPAAGLTTMGNRREAALAYHEALVIVEPLLLSQPANVAALYAAADVYFGIGELSKADKQRSVAPSETQRNSWAAARAWYRKSAEAWRRIPNPARISPDGFACGNPGDVDRMIPLCDTALRKADTPDLWRV